MGFPRLNNARRPDSGKVVIGADHTTARPRRLPLAMSKPARIALAKQAQIRGREADGLTQDEVGALCDVSQQRIASQEHPGTDLTMSTAQLLALTPKAFDETIANLCEAREKAYGEPERRVVTVSADCRELEAAFANLLEARRHESAAIAELAEKLAVGK